MRQPVPLKRGSLLALSWLLLGLLLWGCGSDKQRAIIKQASGPSLTAADIDREPLLLLPRGAIGLARVDVRSSVQTELGRELLARAELRLPESINFRVERDLALVYLGAYALQGVDFAGVAIGQFDAKAIAETAASQHRDSPAGAVLVQSQYAGRTLYTIGNIGCSLLTDKTLLFGNEIGMRRALDRIESGRVGDDVEPWLRELFRVEAASIALGVDFAAVRPPKSAEARAPLLAGLDRARVLGNFEPPGINLAGTLSYPDAAAAERGASAIDAFRKQLQGAGLVASLLGAAQPITKLDARVVQQDTQFVLEVDGRLLLALIDRFVPRSTP